MLGGFSLVVAQGVIPVPNNAQRVLGFLAVTGLVQRRDSIATHLWSYASPERAMANLRTALWRVRQADPYIIRAGRDAIQLEEHVHVDYELVTSQAKRIIDESGSVPDPDDWLAGVQVDLLEADLLPGWDEEWLLLDRERHRQLRIHALESISVYMTDKGYFGRAIDAACAAIRIEPLHESAHAALIAAHMAEGNRLEAIRQFETYSRLLEADVGLMPSPQLRGLLRPT